MDELLVGTLLPGATPIHRGNINPVWRGNVLLDGYRRQMYVKRVPPRTLTVEVICALMGRALKMPVPRPAIVLVNPGVLGAEGLVSEPEYFFGAESVDNPDLKQWVAQNEEGFEVILKWSLLLDAGCYDEWIANGDRHGGNILYGGGNNFALIDHSEALPAHLAANRAVASNNLLKIKSDRKSAREIHELYRKALGITFPYGTARISDQVINTLEEITTTNDASELVHFLDERINSLMVLISSRIGHRQSPLVLKK